MSDTVADLFGRHPCLSGYDCAFCRKPAHYQREVNTQDRSLRMFRFFCSTACEANWGTGQKP